MTLNNIFQCACCTPSRQIYMRAERPGDRPYHEHDHTPAVRSAPELEKRRQRVAALVAGNPPATSRRREKVEGPAGDPLADAPPAG